MRSHRFLSVRLAATVLAIATLSGCGKGKGEISGKVIFRNQPLPSGKITFYVADKPGVRFFSDIKDGEYTIRGCPPGPVKVTVETVWLPDKPDPRRAPKDTLKDFASKFEDREKPGVFVPIPKRYSDPDRSELTYEVESGSQTKDFELAEK
jgi:hypothetical protein